MRALLMAVLLPAALLAQNTSGSLSGTVVDSAGSVVPNAKVTLTGEANGFVRTALATSEGFFSLPDLTPATFTLAIEAPGFKIYRQTGVAITASEERSLGRIKLQVGQLTESVTVSAEAIAVDLATGERSGTLSGQQLDEIALRGRDIFDAISLLPGVVDTSDGRDAPSPTSISGIYILGGRNDQKNMTVDGVTNLDTGSNGSVHSMPSMDSVAQVKVLMSAYSAENGRNPSAISVITKGGTMQFHGMASYYFRNEDLNANNFFSNQAGRPIPAYRYNIGSWTIGGPAILPKLPSLRNKLFFFFSQEFQRQIQTYGVQKVTVPTPLERQGNFSQTYNSDGSALVKVNDPLNKNTQFPGNVIPLSRFNPIGQAVLNLFPLPNYSDPNPATHYQWNYYAQASEPYPRTTETARVDYSPRQNWQVFVSLSNNSDSQAVPYSGGSAGWVAGSLNYPLVPISYQQPGRLGTLHSANSVTPTLFNEAVFAVSQNTLTYSPLDPGLVDRTKLGITLPQRDPSLNVLNAIPNMTFSGNVQHPANPSMSDGTPYFNQNTIYSFLDNISRLYGTHTFKFGIYYEHTQKIQSANAATRGSISFATDGNNPYNTNYTYSNALLGYYDTYSEATGRPQANYQYINFEWFAQDTWRVRHNLSLDYGVRFYHDPPQYDARLQLSSFSAAAYSFADAPVLLRPVKINGVNYAQDPTTGQTYSNGLVGDFAPGAGNLNDGMLIGGKNGVPRGLFSVPAVAVAPRFGFAWDPFGTGRTAIRGGAGMYLDRIQGNPVMGQLQQPAFFSPTQFYGTFSDIAASASTGYLSPGSVSSIYSPGHQQVVYNYNLSIQRQVGRSNVLDVGYSGSLGRHLLWVRNVNPVPPGSQNLAVNPQNANPQNTGNSLPTNFLVPYPGYGAINLYEFANNSNYHALMASFQHRMARSLTLNANYTFSKALDCSDGYGSSVDPFLNIHSRDYGPAGFDRRHVFTANFFWTLPKPGRATGVRPIGWIADNWTVSGVVRFITGGPTTLGYSTVNGITSPTGTPTEGARPEVVNPTAPLGPVFTGGAIATTTRFAPAPEPAGENKVAWSVPTSTPEFGNLGRNTFYGPGVNNWDLSMYREIGLTERLKSQLRIETYNTFNHTQWGSVNSTLQFDSKGSMINTAFDLPDSARPARIVQVALRFWF